MLKKNNIISSMNEEVKKKLVSFFKSFELTKYGKGKIIFRPGEKLPGIIFVKSGYVRMYSLTKDGKEVTFPLMKPLFFASMVCTMTGMDNGCFFETITPVEVWIAPAEKYVEYIKKDKMLYEDMTKSVVNEFVEMTCNLQQLISSNAEAKLAKIIHIIAARFGEKKNNGRLIKFSTPHRLLASMTGLTRETVTLQLIKMAKLGILENKGERILIKDEGKLKELAGIG